METKYHRVYAKVDLDAIRDNVNAIRAHVNQNSIVIHSKNVNETEINEIQSNAQEVIQEKVKIMAVIKADGYGHGAIPIGRELENLGIDYIAIAIYQEGIQLRKEGIQTPILVLGNTPSEAFDQLIKYDLAQTVYSVEMGRQLEKTAKSMNKVAKIHLKIDTGMGRIGLRCVNQDPMEVALKVQQLYELEYLHMEGIFTHFSKADEKDKSYTAMQVRVFEKLLDELRDLNILPEIVHASNSAGLIDVNQANYNMVRAGIALYGLYPSEEVQRNIVLRPALSIISRIVFVKEVEKGEAISYGGIYITDKQSKIATIPIGYADGYSRALSNKGRVVIRGQYAPVVGRVCMDQIMVDVTHIENVKENDEVYLVGGTEKANISIEEIAKIMHTINYEVVCLIGKRVPRVYVKEKEVVESIDYFY